MSPLPPSSRPGSRPRPNKRGIAPWRVWATGILLSLGACGTGHASEFLIRDGDRIVFYGDSITAGEWYPVFIETYLLTRYPQWQNDLRVRGVGGDKASNIERFRRDALSLRPDLLTFMMGYNDANFRPLSEETLTAFLQSVTKAVAMTRTTSPGTRILLASDPINELPISDDPEWISRRFYPYTLLRLARAQRRLAGELNVPFLNVAEVYGKVMALGHAIAPEAFGLSRDGVHPQQEGQFFIACAFLEAMQADPWVADLELDAAPLRVVRSQRCKIEGLKRNPDGSLEWRRKAEALPFFVPEMVRPFAFLMEPEERLSRDRLKIKAPSAPAYRLEVDDETLGTLSAESLAQGINLSCFPNSPMNRQAAEVLGAARRRQNAEQVLWSRFIARGLSDPQGRPYQDPPPPGLPPILEELDAATAECHRVNQPLWHRFKLTPQENAAPDPLLAPEDELAHAFLEIKADPLEAPLREGSEAVLVLTNPSDSEKQGIIRWNLPPGWSMEKPVETFRLASGEERRIAFPLSGPGSAPVPTATIRWQWSQTWPYPMSETHRLPLQPHLTLPYLPIAPGLKGRLTDWQECADVILDQETDTNRRIAGKQRLWKGPEDLSARLFLGWREEGLYIAAQVRDDEHSTGDEITWHDDLLHVFVAIEGDKGALLRQQFGFGLPSRGEAQSLSIPESTSPRRFHIRRTDGETFYEVHLPWAALPPFQAKPDACFRLNIGINDRDASTHKGFTALEWTQGINYRNTPEYFPVLKLGQKL